MIHNVLDFPTSTDAFNAASDGDVIYFPALAPYTAPSGGWVVSKSLTIRGDGAGIQGQATGTILRAASANNPVLAIVGPVSDVHIHDLQLQRGGTGAGSGVGILCRSTSTTKRVANLQLRGLQIHGFPSHGIHLEGFDTTTSKVERVYMAECEILSCGGAGVRLVNAFDVCACAVLCEGHQRQAFMVTGGSASLYQCGFRDNCLSPIDPLEAFAQFQSCEMVRVDACTFKNYARGVVVDGGVGMVGWCSFENDFGSSGESIRVTGTGTGPIAILSNRNLVGPQFLVKVDSGVRNCVIYPQHDEFASGSIVVPSGNGNSGVPLSAPLTRQGLIVPSASADPTDRRRTGMLVYVNGTLKVFDGTTWRSVVTESA